MLLETDGADRRRSAARCRSLSEAFAALSLNIPLEDVVRAHEASASWLASVWEKNEEVTHLDQVRFILREASKGAVSLRPEWMGQLTEAYVSPLFKEPPRLDAEAAPTLAWLRDQGKRVGLISNVGRTPGVALRRFLAKEGLSGFFDAMLFSDEVRVRKPSREIFQMAAEKLGVAPAEILHVGDNLKADVWGARNAGMKAVLLSSEAGRDREAEADPSSLVSISRRLEAGITASAIAPDATITKLGVLAQALSRLEETWAKAKSLR